ncbi:uncharacterized protein LOC111372919, partial [Olea europaea var. sylvestris]|uniref:uncharacterized protein LOC111372919 n=1 Tax=Olea europaea var. sylvestris TaxID=158386 RepID=UPI000C1CD969
MPHGKLEDITFGTRDLEGVSLPHDDALVISAIVANFEVKRILVDNGSASNIFSQKAFAKMEISSQQLKAVKTPLQGFGRGVIIPEGVIELPLTLGSGQKQVTEMTSFQVVRVSLAYNAILGRPLLNKIKTIVSTFLQAMKTELEIGQQVRLAPVEELMEIELEHDKKKVEDMPRIDPKIAVHRLNISPGTKPVKQRKRQFAPECREVIREEINKLVSAQFIREVQYPDCIANVVLVKKANGKWRVSIDFTNINKACPKDSYPLPRIDNLVDITSGHKLYSFLDAFSVYHQILMAKEDQEKTSFMADSTIYCYKELKQTLASPPVLTRPEPGDTLFLYLVVSQNAISGVFVKQ